MRISITKSHWEIFSEREMNINLYSTHKQLHHAVRVKCFNLFMDVQRGSGKISKRAKIMYKIFENYLLFIT